MKKLFLLLFFAAALLAPALADPIADMVKSAPGQTDDAGARVLYWSLYHSMPSPGLSHRELETAVRIYNQSGRGDYGDIPVFFNRDTTRLTLQRGGTYDAAGGFIPLEEKGVNTVTAPNFKDSLSYGDFVNRVFSFSSLENGNTVYLSYGIDTDLEETYISGMLPLQRFEAADRQQVVIEIPAGRTLRWRLQGKDRMEKTERDGRTVYTLHIDPKSRLKKEEGLPPVERIADYFIYSSAADWNEAVGFVYDALEGAVDTNDAIRERGVSLTHGKTGRDEKLASLIDFVAHTLNDVYLPLGTASYNPRKATEVLRTGYGDSRDKYVLFAALCRAAGIDGVRPALVRGGFLPVYGDVPTVRQFSAVMAAVRKDDGSYGLMDLSGRETQYGFVTSWEGAQALLLDGANPRLIDRTSYFTLTNSAESLIEGTLTASGAFSGTLSLKTGGIYDELARTDLAGLRGQGKKMFFDRIGEAFSAGTEVKSFETSRPDDYFQPSFMKLSVDSPEYALAQDRFLMLKISSIPLRYSFVSYSLTLNQREYPFLLGTDKESRLTAKIRLPEGYRPVFLPKTFHLEREYGTFSKRCTVENSVLVYESFVSVNKLLLSPEEYQDFRSVLENFKSEESKLLLLEKNR